MILHSKSLYDNILRLYEINFHSQTFDYKSYDLFDNLGSQINLLRTYAISIEVFYISGNNIQWLKGDSELTTST